MGRGRSLCLKSVAETRILNHGSKMSTVNHTKQHYLVWLHLGRADSNPRVKRFDPRCPDLPLMYLEVVTSRAHAAPRLAGQSCAPFPLSLPCQGSPVGTRSAGAYLAHSHWRFELHTSTSLPLQDAAHHRESMGRCQPTTSCSSAPQPPPYAGTARPQHCMT